VHFHRNKWVWFLVAGTLFGAVSSLYDKYLLGRLRFSCRRCRRVLSLPGAAFHAVRHRLEAALVVAQRISLALEHSIHRLSLLAADYIYFSALRDPASLVAVVMSLRRGSTLVGFAGGLLLFGEKKRTAKNSPP